MNDIQTKLKGAFLNVFKTLDDRKFDLDKPRSEFENWDSLAHLQIVSEIESVFGVSFTLDEIVEINKPGDFLPVLEKKLATKNGQ